MFNKRYKDTHTFSAGIYSEYFKAHFKGFGFRANGLNASNYYPGDGDAFITDNGDNDDFVDTINANLRNAGLFSYFTTVDYDYKAKYGLSGTFRRDASYRFRKSNRWGNFYSISGRWNLDKEKFLEKSKFNLLKIRASHGTNGNQNITGSTGSNAYFGGANLGLDLFSTGSGYGGQNSLIASQFANSDLIWETVTQSNLGLDFEYNSRLRGNLDFYKKTTTDLYEFQNLPSYTGTTGQFVNGEGEMVNQGIELVLSYDLLKKVDGFNMTLKFNGDYNKNQRFGSSDSTVEDGGKINQVYTYRYAGVNPANGNLFFYDIDGNLTENPDPEADRVFLDKSIHPDYQGGFGIDMDYKGFYLNTQFNYVIGVDRFDFDYYSFLNPGNIGQFRHSRDILRAWTPENRITDIPSLNASNIALGVNSDMFLQNADYLRLRYINFGYSFPKKYLNKIFLGSIKTYINAENLITFTGWRGNDVEGIAGASRGYPTPKIISFGIELGF